MFLALGLRLRFATLPVAAVRKRVLAGEKDMEAELSCVEEGLAGHGGKGGNGRGGTGVGGLSDFGRLMLCRNRVEGCIAEYGSVGSKGER